MFLNLPKKIIGTRNLNQDVYALNAGENYLFKIPIKIINYDSSKVKKIKVSFINEEKFLNIFDSSIFTSNDIEKQKSYSYNDFYNGLLNDSFLKSVYKNYNNVMTEIGDGDNVIYQTSTFDENNITRFQFNSTEEENNASYLEELSNRGSTFLFSTSSIDYNDSYYYLFSLSSEKSHQILENRSFFVRIAILDDYDNIVDYTSFSYVNFESIARNNSIRDYSSYISSELFNMGVPDTLDLTLNVLQDEDIFSPEISVQGFLSLVRNLNLDVIEDIDLTLTYFSESLGEQNSIQIFQNFSQFFINENNNFTIDEQNEYYNEFLNSLIYDYYFLEKQEYIIDIQISVNYLSTDESLQSLNFNHQITKTRSSNIFTVLLNRNNSVCLSFFTNILNNIEFTQEYEKSGNFIKTTLTLDSIEIDQNIKRKIFIKSIIKNQNLLENIYNDETELLSNKVNYRGKSFLEIFETFGSFTFYNRLNTDSYLFEYTIGYEDIFLENINKRYVSRNLYFPRNVVTRENINKVNFLFSKNLKIDLIQKNLELDEFNKQSFVKYENFELKNISNFNELAYDYGYVNEENNLGDAASFLRNCIVLVENVTQVKELNIKSVRSNIFYFDDFFEEDFVITNNRQTTEKYFTNNQSIDLNTPDITRLNQTNNNTRLLNLFKTCTESQSASLKIKNLKRLKKINKNISIKNKIEITLMPVPEIIGRYKGYGLDNFGNPIDDSLHDVTALDKTLLSKSFYDLFYSSEQSLSKSLFESYVSNFMDPEISNNVSKFYKMFLQATKRKITNNSYFKQNNEININEYIQFLEESNDVQTVRSDNVMLSFKQNSFEENIHNKFFKEINYKINKNIKFPYTFIFKNLQRKTDLERQEIRNSSISSKKQIYSFTSKDYLFNDSIDEVSFNITNLAELHSISDILNNSVFKVRSCPILLLTNFQENISDENKVQIEDLQKGYSVVNYNNSDCVVYNYDYIRNPSRRTNFSQYLNSSFFDQDYSINNFSNKIIFNLQSNSFQSSYVRKNDLNEFIQDCESYGIKYIKNLINRIAISIQIKNSMDQVTDFYTLYYNIPLNSNINKLNNNIIYDISYMTNVYSRVVSSNT